MEGASLQRSAVVAVEGVLVILFFKADYRALAALGGVDVNAGIVVKECLCCVENSLFAVILHKVEVTVFIVLNNDISVEIYVRRFAKARVAVNAAGCRRFVVRDCRSVEIVVGFAQCAEVDRAAPVVCFVAGKGKYDRLESAVIAYIDSAAAAVCGITVELGKQEFLREYRQSTKALF